MLPIAGNALETFPGLAPRARLLVAWPAAVNAALACALRNVCIRTWISLGEPPTPERVAGLAILLADGFLIQVGARGTPLASTTPR